MPVAERNHVSPRSIFCAAGVCALVLAPAGPALAKGKRDDSARKGKSHKQVAAGPTRTYHVTVTDLTGGQPLAPPVVAVSHRNDVIFKKNKPASYGLKEIAENGQTSATTSAIAWQLTRAKLAGTVFDWAVAATPVVPESRTGATGFPNAETMTITANNRSSRLSWASMLICTNDGFAGVAGLKLPKKLGQKVSYESPAWEAGTERNTENYADLVPPCQGLMGTDPSDPPSPGTGTSNPALVEDGVVHRLAGITGAGQLDPAVYDWAGRRVARIEVERIS
jgi:hypothetical protein